MGKLLGDPGSIAALDAFTPRCDAQHMTRFGRVVRGIERVTCPQRPLLQLSFRRRTTIMSVVPMYTTVR